MILPVFQLHKSITMIDFSLEFTCTQDSHNCLPVDNLPVKIIKGNRVLVYNSQCANTSSSQIQCCTWSQTSHTDNQYRRRAQALLRWFQKISLVQQKMSPHRSLKIYSSWANWGNCCICSLSPSRPNWFRTSCLLYLRIWGLLNLCPLMQDNPCAFNLVSQVAPAGSLGSSDRRCSSSLRSLEFSSLSLSTSDMIHQLVNCTVADENQTH